MDINVAIIFYWKSFLGLITLLNNYAWDQFARLSRWACCEFYFEIGSFTINVAHSGLFQFGRFSAASYGRVIAKMWQLDARTLWECDATVAS